MVIRPRASRGVVYGRPTMFGMVPCPPGRVGVNDSLCLCLKYRVRRVWFHNRFPARGTWIECWCMSHRLWSGCAAGMIAS